MIQKGAKSHYVMCNLTLNYRARAIRYGLFELHEPGIGSTKYGLMISCLVSME
jgi:hypothetical protein